MDSFKYFSSDCPEAIIFIASLGRGSDFTDLVTTVWLHTRYYLDMTG